MTSSIPRILAVTVVGPASLGVVWPDREDRAIDLTDWIATGGPILAHLHARNVFETAHRGDHGASVEWAGSDDLAIDACHLRRIADEQSSVDPAVRTVAG